MISNNFSKIRKAPSLYSVNQELMFKSLTVWFQHSIEFYLDRDRNNKYLLTSGNLDNMAEVVGPAQ